MPSVTATAGKVFHVSCGLNAAALQSESNNQHAYFVMVYNQDNELINKMGVSGSDESPTSTPSHS
jgi:hypothetical protein